MSLYFVLVSVSLILLTGLKSIGIGRFPSTVCLAVIYIERPFMSNSHLNYNFYFKIF